jgi:tetratricopeptide (TPR) repeat protein/O-antigen ligase
VDLRAAPASAETSSQRGHGSRRHDRRSRRGSRPNAAPTFTTAALLGVLVVGAPLTLGAVHRPIVFVTLGVAALLALATVWLAKGCKSALSTALALALPLFFLLVAAAQIVPLPTGLRALLDPKGSALLALADLHGAQPLSLDPPETYGEFAKAAAALCVTLAALVLASGRRLRSVAPGLVACAGLAAVAVGLGHRVANEPMVYGHFRTGAWLMVGPFINPNHTAEFLELSGFAALAFAFTRATRDGQRLWKIAAAIIAAAAISTLSRGSVLALGAGAFTWFVLAPRSDEGEPLHRSRFVAFLLALILVVGITIGFEGDRIIAEFRGTVADNLSKLLVSRDALPMVVAHPAGIGLGAFGRVYPVYQTLRWGAWVEFVENQPVSILIEAGIAGAMILLGLLVLVGRRFWKEARRDRVEASLVAGLVAVLAHNLVDFGLEIPGVLLPFCALLGAIFGRQATTRETSRGADRQVAPTEDPIQEGRSRSRPSRRGDLPVAQTESSRRGDLPVAQVESSRRGDLPVAPVPNRSPVIFAGVACLAALAGIVLLRAPSTRDFDGLLQPPLTSASRALARAASLAHPTDYAYALAEARLEPRGPSGTSATRLRLLNRAIILCPQCSGAHIEAAHDLWRLGRRQQALLEWRTVLALQPTQLSSAVDELARAGAKPAELMSLADEHSRHDLSRLLLARGMIDAARQVLDGGADQSSAEFHLVLAQIALEAKDLPAARAASKQALAAAPRDPRGFLMAAEVESRANDRDKAIQILTDGLRFEPMNVELNRKLLGLLMQTEKWRAIDGALADLRRALSQSGASMTEANLAAASIFEHRGQFQRALAEYQAVVASDPENPGLLLYLARAAEQAGSVTVAIDAYNAVLRLAPGQAEALAALARIQHDKKALEVLGALPSHTTAEDK